MTREDIEKVLSELAADVESTEAEASMGAEELLKKVSGTTPLRQVNPDSLRATADDVASGIERLKLLESLRAKLRQLLT